MAIPKVTIIDGNNEIELSTIEDNVKAFMVKGEPGTDAVSPSITTERDGKVTTITIVDKDGTKEADINDGFDPVVNVSKENRVTTVTATDIYGTTTVEIPDGIDLTGGVPTNGVIGYDTDEIIYICDGTETGNYYLTYNNVNYYFTMPTVEDGDALRFNTTDLTLKLNNTTIITSSTGTGTELTFNIYIPNGYEIDTSGGGSQSVWGDITGNISDQEDLQTALNEKLPAYYDDVGGKYLIQNAFDVNVSSNYSVLPRSVIVPNNDNDFTNKKYVDKHGVNVGTTQNNAYPVNILQSKNLFDKNDNIVSGEYFNESNGNIQTTTTPNNYLQEDYIKVKPNTQYIVSASSGSQFIRIIEYTSSLSFIKGTSSSSSNTLSITTSSTTQYIRMSMFGSDVLDTLQLEEGNTATTYEPYNTSQIIANDKTIYYGANQNYSTAEQRIGTWIDGKPLYRKTFQKIVNVTGTDTTIINLSTETPNYQHLWIDESNSFMEIGNQSLPLNWYSSASDYIRTSVSYLINSVRTKGTTLSGVIYYVTLLYTKTTD